MSKLDDVLATLPHSYAGPGGAVAVLRDGEVLARHTWGWADAERRIPFTAETMFLICSITKQFTCGLVLDQFDSPEALDADVARMLPNLQVPAPLARDLCNNQSGLRDYWATAMLCGAPPESRFGPEHARALIARSRTLQFEPGTSYSYCNQNFRILADVTAERSGRSYGELLRSRIFDRVGMPHARVNADTFAVEGGTIGYEGSVEAGFRPAVNNINWTGDAGISASLDDFIAWEKFIDATRDDADGLYNRLSAPATFRNGAAAQYGFGLGRAPIFGRAATGHGGGLRGWRSYRFNIPAERISVVVLFNHMADTHAAAMELLATQIDAQPAPAATQPFGWTGRFLEPQTGLAVRVDTNAAGRPRMNYDRGRELLTSTGADRATGGSSTLRAGADGLWMDRPTENQSSRLTPQTGRPAQDIEGVFHNAEYDADLTIAAAGDVLYAAFSGTLGEGSMQLMQPFATDVWLVPCPRALDHSAPGDWTLRIERDATGKASGLRLGCWLARDIPYLRAR